MRCKFWVALLPLADPVEDCFFTDNKQSLFLLVLGEIRLRCGGRAPPGPLAPGRPWDGCERNTLAEAPFPLTLHVPTQINKNLYLVDLVANMQKSRRFLAYGFNM